MGEYIQSNDDSSNLGLYAGIGITAALGAAALTYRATRGPSNGKTVATGSGVDEGKGIVMRYDGEGKASGLRGGFRALTAGIFNKEQRHKGMNEFAQAAIDSAMESMTEADIKSGPRRNATKQQETWQGKLGVLKEIGEGSSPDLIEGDITKAKEIINNGGKTKKGKNAVSAKDALDQILLENPYSALTESDITTSMERDAVRHKKVKEDDAMLEAINRAGDKHRNTPSSRKSSDARERSRLKKEKEIADSIIEKRTGKPVVEQIESESSRQSSANRDKNQARAESTRQEIAQKEKARRAEREAHPKYPHTSIEDTRSLLAMNPTITNSQLRKQVSGSEKLDDEILNTQRTRAASRSNRTEGYTKSAEAQRGEIKRAVQKRMDEAREARAQVKENKPKTYKSDFEKAKKRYNKLDWTAMADPHAEYEKLMDAENRKKFSKEEWRKHNPKSKGPRKGFAKVLSKAL